MTKLTMVQAINQALAQEMAKDKDVLVLGEDVGTDGGVFRCTDGLLAKFGSERVIDTPLSEDGIVGTAFGMSILGLKPVAEIQFFGFIYPAFQQLISHVARIRNRSRGRFNSHIVVRSPYGGGFRSLEHHAEAMEALFVHTPGLKVVIPSTPEDAKGLLTASIRDPDPVLFFEPIVLYRAFKQEVSEENYATGIGKAKIVKEGSDVTIVSYGTQMANAIEAAERLEKQKVSCEVIDLRSLSPLDEKTILDSVRKTGRCVVVQEAPRTLGMASEIIALINDFALFDLKGPVGRVTGFDCVPPLAKLEHYYLPNASRVMHEVKKTMKY